MKDKENMNFNVLICLFLWPCATFAVALNYNSPHGEQRKTTSGGQEEKRDQTSVPAPENNSGKFQGIQADSLGSNNQATLSPSVARETVLKELEEGGPVFDHEAGHGGKASETIGTEAGDMSQYDNEDIKIVKASSHSNRHQTPKPVRLPSLTDEGKVDTVLAKSAKVKDTIGASISKKTDSDVKIFELPSYKIFDDDDNHLPSSAKQLLGESDNSSLEKLRKSGERFSTFYDNDINAALKKVEEPHGSAVGVPLTHRSTLDMGGTKINIKGGQIVGGQITGGNILGGNIHAGFIGGGTITAGYVKGGRMTGGTMDGGTLMGDGAIEGGFFKNGTIKGGDVKGGNITGGTISGGVVLGGHVSGGFVAGGVLKKGGVEGGVLRGGTIDGGILKGGVMESGQLLGGTVWNGRVTGGTILGGDVLGGEIGEGVVIRGGKINGTVTVGRRRGTSSLGSTKPPTSTISGGVIGRIAPAKEPKPQNNPGTTSNQVSPLSSGSEAVVIHPKKPSVVLSSNLMETMDDAKRNYEPKDFFGRPAVSTSASSSPGENYARQNSPGARSSYSGGDYGRGSYPNVAEANNAAENYAASRTQTPLAIAIPRSRPSGININQFVKQVSTGVQRSSSDNNIDVKPDFHWTLNQIKDGEVTGSPGNKFVAKGGIRLNRASIGFDGSATFMDGGDYAGTCVSDPDLCPRGISVEMTIKIDREATSYREPRYILDTGASSFNSRGVALYTIDSKLRADVAVKNTAYCLQAPLAVDKWQDVVLTFNKNGELNMYINCKLVATTESDDQCISCHSPGCHTSDENTNLILGKANHEPSSSFAKFKAGDLSIYERYLNPQDIDKICGFSKDKPSPNSKNVVSSRPPWASPALNSNIRIQAGSLKSGISNPRKDAVIPTNVPYFSSWGNWSICSSKCGSGTKVRQRSCIYTYAQSGWQTCHGVTFQAKKCSAKCQVPTGQSNQTKKVDASNNLAPANKTNSEIITTNLNSKEKDEKNGNVKLKLASRRNRISRILTKLGHVLTRL